jgi:hypothetical protein
MIETPTTSRPDASRAEPARLGRLGATSAGLCGLLLALTTACAQKPLCPELGTCGGNNPVGDWVLSPGHPSCSEELYQVPPDPRLARGDQPAARLPVPEESLYDWCDALIFKGDDPGAVDSNHTARFTVADQAIGAAVVHYDGANYAFSLTKTGTYIADYPSVCVRGFGAMDNANGGVCTQVQTYLTAKSKVGQNLICVPSPNDANGCTCRFDLSSQVGGSGQYQAVSSNTLVHALTARLDRSQAADFPAYATFCNKGSSLQLTGANGAYLFNAPGLRTLDLSSVTINCTDGVKGIGEDGVDCGVACPMACP